MKRLLPLLAICISANAQSVSLASTNMTFPNSSGVCITDADIGTVSNTMLTGSIAASKLVGTDIVTVGAITTGTWSATALVAAKLPNAGVATGDATSTFPSIVVNSCLNGKFIPAGPTTARTYTFPDASATIARTDAANTFTGVQTMTSPALTTPVLGTPSSGTLTSCTGYTTANLSGTITNAQLAGSIDLATKTTGQGPYTGGHEAGTAATTATTGTMTVTMTSAVITITPTGACTFNASGGLTGQTATFAITTSGTSSFVLTFGTNFVTTGTLATGTVTAKRFTITFRCINGTAWWETSRTAAM